MNKAELIVALAEKTGISQKEAKKVLDACVEITTECLVKRDELVLVGFGTLAIREQSKRLARNPQTGEPVMIQPRSTVRFKPGKFLLEAINNKQ